MKNWFSYRRKIFLRQSSGPKPSIEKEMHNKVPTPTEIEKPMFSPVEKSEPINQRNMNSYDNSFGSMGYLNMMPFIGAAQIKNQLVNANLLNWTFNAYNQLIRNQQYFRMINSFLSKN